jgi:hypothetical protein
MRTSIFLTAAAFGLVFGGAVSAQAASPHFERVRGTIASFQGGTLTVKTDSGDKTIAVGDKTGISAVRKIAMSEIKPGSYIGTAAVPGKGKNLRALEVLVFPAAMKGVGEGHTPYDLGTDSSMTNGTVGKVTTTPVGRQITVSYKSGSQTVTVPNDVPIVTFAPADRGDLKAGARVFVIGTASAGGAVNARLVSVEKNGVAPPM